MASSWVLIGFLGIFHPSQPIKVLLFWKNPFVRHWMYIRKTKVRVQVQPWLLSPLTEVEGTIWHLCDFFLKRRNYSEELSGFPQLTSLVTGSRSHKKWWLFEGTQKEQSANSKNGTQMWRNLKNPRAEFWLHTLSGIEIWVFSCNSFRSDVCTGSSQLFNDIVIE